VFTDICPFDF